jgi:beta-RFAP synthase
MEEKTMRKVNFFVPGEDIVTKGVTKKAKPVVERIKFMFPARVHITLIDSNRLDFGKPGGGGLGFGVQMDNWMEVSLSQEDYQDSTEDSQPLIAHMTFVMKKILNHQGGIQIKLNTRKFLQPHKGLGSTTAILTACAQGINMLFGSPLTTEEIREIVAYNFVEVCDGKLAKGMETGVGTYLILKGGFVIVGGDLKVIYRRRFFPSYNVVLVDPGLTRFQHKEPENIPEFKRVQEEDQAFRYQKVYLLVMDLIPALYSNDFEKIGNIIWRFQWGGNNLLEFEKYPNRGKRILDIMHELRYCCQPKPIVGITSLGPMIFAICKNPDSILKTCECFNAKTFVTKMDNEGLKVLEK